MNTVLEKWKLWAAIWGSSPKCFILINNAKLRKSNSYYNSFIIFIESLLWFLHVHSFFDSLFLVFEFTVLCIRIFAVVYLMLPLFTLILDFIFFYFVGFTVIVCSMINCTQNLVVCLKSVIYFGATVVTIFVLMIMVSLMQLPLIYSYIQSNITLDLRPLKCFLYLR